jgi:hypothetical protein
MPKQRKKNFKVHSRTQGKSDQKATENSYSPDGKIYSPQASRPVGFSTPDHMKTFI